MALIACSWAGRFFGLACLLVTTFAVLMGSIFHRRSLSLCLCLMARATCLWDFAWFLIFQFVVAFYAFKLQIDMLLMAEFYLTKRIVHSVIIFCLLLSKNAAHHENREKKNRENPDADQTLFHSFFTPSLSNLDPSPPDLLDLKSLTNIQFLSRKKTGWNFVIYLEVATLYRSNGYPLLPRP
jgi:hypothetical protein